MLHTYIAHDRRDGVVMLTVFPGNGTARYQENTYGMGETITRAAALGWLRYWRRCGWTIRRVV